eukprot:scaffold78229_cov47-Phaeocystis_antarctica.AAC.2
MWLRPDALQITITDAGTLAPPLHRRPYRTLTAPLPPPRHPLTAPPHRPRTTPCRPNDRPHDHPHCHRSPRPHPRVRHAGQRGPREWRPAAAAVGAARRINAHRRAARRLALRVVTLRRQRRMRLRLRRIRPGTKDAI